MLDQITLEHYKLLYLVSRYSMYARNVTDNETWVRYQPLLVLMYELIVAGVIDYDYRPRVGDGFRATDIPQRDAGREG